MDKSSHNFVDMAGTSEFSTVQDESRNNSQENTDDEDRNDHSNTETYDDDLDGSDLSDSSESNCSIYRYEVNRKGESTCEDSDLIPNHTPKLEKMASVSVAIALWNHAMSSIPELKPDEHDCRRSLLDQIPKWTAQLRLPKSLSKNIENQFQEIVMNVYCWIYFHTRVVKIETDLHRHMHCIVWYPNGAINDYQTAVNLMKLDQLSNEEKYRLACMYCMKEEVEERRKTLIGNPMLDVKINQFYRDPLVTYWNCYYTGKLHMVPRSFKLRHPKSSDIKLTCDQNRIIHGVKWRIGLLFHYFLKYL